MQEYSYSQKRFGTTATISLVMESAVQAEQIIQAGFALLATYEARFSRFLPDSELSSLNSKKELVVSDEFFLILKLSYDLYKKTGGIFNPLVQVARAGYNAPFGEIKNTPQKNIGGIYNIDFNSVYFDDVTKKVILQSEQKIDFGGILKGYLAEKISKGISTKNPQCQGNIVNLGGDIHTEGVDETGRPFKFMIYNPNNDTEIPILLSDTSLATSGTYSRTWQTFAGPMHHILGPDGIKNSDSDLISASVIHKNGAVAEAMAKVFLVIGATKIPETILLDDYQCLLINKDGKINRTAI